MRDLWLPPCVIVVATMRDLWLPPCSQEVPRWPSIASQLSVYKWLLIIASCVNGLAISYTVCARSGGDPSPLVHT